jgi:hypothetical protein
MESLRFHIGLPADSEQQVSSRFAFFVLQAMSQRIETHLRMYTWIASDAFVSAR